MGNQMSLSRFLRPNESNCEVNGGKGGYSPRKSISENPDAVLAEFVGGTGKKRNISEAKNLEPLVRAKKSKKEEDTDREFLAGLPVEMIEHVFSFLDVKDRMRLRLNKRLSKIESTSNYYLGRVVLREDSRDNTHITIKNRRYSLDFLCRIAQNASIRELDVFLSSSAELNSKFLDLTKEIKNIGELQLYFRMRDEGNLNEFMSDSFFLDLTGRCKTLCLSYQPSMSCNNISSESFHHVYKSMSEGTISLRRLFIDACFNEEKLNAFLNLRGIAYRNGRIISSRNIEAYKDQTVSYQFFDVNILDGFFHITFTFRGFGLDYSVFIIELHENLESLNSVKNVGNQMGWERMSVYSE